MMFCCLIESKVKKKKGGVGWTRGGKNWGYWDGLVCRLFDCQV